MIKDIVNSRRFYTLDELKSYGYSQYLIGRLVEDGKLVKLNKKMYENLEFDGEDSEFCYVFAYIPQGVICLMSAAAYYNLTTYRTDAIDVAIPRKSRVSTLPEWPEISLHYYTDYRFEKGIESISVGEDIFRIYDIEKTVCDIVFYRETIGLAETKEILVKYLQRKDRNLNKLIRYAKDMKCDRILKTYLEILV